MSTTPSPEANPIPIELAREIARQGDARLTALMGLATAADLRATTFCGILGAGSVGAAAAVLAVFVSEHRSAPLIAGGIVLSLGLFLGAICAAWASAPRDFFVGGGNPDKLRGWAWVGDHWRDEFEMLDASAERYARSIAANRTQLTSNSRWMKAALWIALATLVVSIATFFAECDAILPF
jgi:hypothetical protein